MRFGRYIPQGVAVGIDADTEKALRAIRQMDDEIVKEMKKSVAFEMGNVSANASLNINKEQPLIIARDHTVNIENTQIFDTKESTPYQEQKQAKEQLRKLAYDL